MNDPLGSRTARLTLSVIFPTRRSDRSARQVLTTVAMAGSADLEVLIGDNSADPKKWGFLETLRTACTNVHVFCHDEDIGAYRNYIFLLQRATGDLVCLTADDDFVATDYYTGAASILAAEPDVAVAAGLLIGVTPTKDGSPAQLCRATSRTEDSALERIRQFGGANLPAYAAARRTSVLRMASYLEATPLRASFMDYLATYALLAEGKFRIDDARPVYLYVNTQWRDEQTAWKTSADYYVAGGLPESFQHLHSLTWAIACLHLFLSNYRPPSLDTLEAEQIAELLYARWLGDYLEKHDRDPVLRRNLLASSAAAQQAHEDLLKPAQADVACRFSRFLTILTAFSPALAERYRAFLNVSLLDPRHRPGSAQGRLSQENHHEPRPSGVEAAAEIEQLRARVQALETSTSWRLTAPLRLVGSWFFARRR